MLEVQTMTVIFQIVNIVMICLQFKFNNRDMLILNSVYRTSFLFLIDTLV